MRTKMISEANCMQQLYDYTESNYDNECQKYLKECPYSVNLSPELKHKQVYTWFMTEKVLPTTGRTVLDEFVEKHVQPKKPELAKKMLQMKEVIRGTFKVLDVAVVEFITVEHKETGMIYKVVPISEKFRKSFSKEDVITNSRIYPWGDTFRFAGIVTREESDEELAKRLGLITPEMARGWIEHGWTEDAE